MILKRPYAFLIKYFKIIHIFLFAILSINVFKLRKIYIFFKDIVTANGNYVYVDHLAREYIPFLLILSVIIILVAVVLIYSLMKRKDKPVLYYRLFTIYSALLIVVLIFYRNVFNTIEFNNLELTQYIVYRDLMALFYYANFAFLIFTFIRGFGFDIKKFSFEKDMQELDLNETDSEEVEIKSRIDADEIKTKLRRNKRELSYFLQENKEVLLFMVGIIVLGVAIYILLNLFLFNRTYHMNDKVNHNNMYVQAVDCLVLDSDKYGFPINKNKKYIAVTLNIKNLGETTKLDNQFIKLVVNGKDAYFYDYTLRSKFSDLGTVYDDEKIYKNKEQKYLYVFEVKDQKLLTLTLKVKDGNKYHNIKLDFDENEKKSYSYKISEPIKYNDIKILNYDTSSKYLEYNTQSCTKDNKCTTYSKIVNPKINESIVVIEIEGTLKESVIKSLESYASFKYTINNKEITYSAKDTTILDYYTNENTFIYFSINNQTSDFNTLDLIINDRHNIETIRLIGD